MSFIISLVCVLGFTGEPVCKYEVVDYCEESENTKCVEVNL